MFVNSTVLQSIVKEGDGRKNNLSKPAVIFILVSLVICCFMGTFGNSATIMAVIMHRRLRVLHSLFIVNLAVVDLINTAILMPVSLYSAITLRQPPACNDLLPFVSLTISIVSLLNLSLISINRYVAIVEGQNSYRRWFSKRRSFAYTVTIWITGGLLSLPPLVGFGEYGYHERMGICFLRDKKRENYWFLSSIICLVTVPFLITTVFSYTKILLRFYSLKIRVDSLYTTGIHCSTDSQKSSETPDSFGRKGSPGSSRSTQPPPLPNYKVYGPTFPIANRRQMDMFRIAFSCVSIWLFYVVIWSPNLTLHIVDYNFTIDEVYYKYLWAITNTNFAINAIFYGVLTRTFKKAFVHIFLCRFCRSRKVLDATPANTMSFYSQSTI